MNDRVACDDIVWQNWLKLITANNHKKVLLQDNNKAQSSL
jgi:hypothetical protein